MATYGSVITLDKALFRSRFAQFANVGTFPDATLDTQWIVATQFISDTNYGDLAGAGRELAIQYMLAHILALGVIIAAGGTYTGQAGIVTGAQIDKVNITLAAPPYGSDEWKWWLNTTPYGPQLLALLATVAAGGFYYGGLPERAAFRKVGGFY